jgi:XTP/dITP diphosphohydrolase
MSKILLASNNQGKIAEIKALLPQYEVFGLKDIGVDIDVVEDKDSFEGNALKKAQEIGEAYPEYWVLADDSGLCCEALDGAPGIYSARYAGENADSEDNMYKLLNELEGNENRSAYFICVLAFYRNGLSYLFDGKVFGTIAKGKSGNKGFGYDPLFIPEGYSETFADLPSRVKKEVSHRANALDKLMTFLNDD